MEKENIYLLFLNGNYDSWFFSKIFLSFYLLILKKWSKNILKTNIFKTFYLFNFSSIYINKWKPKLGICNVIVSFITKDFSFFLIILAVGLLNPFELENTGDT